MFSKKVAQLERLSQIEVLLARLCIEEDRLSNKLRLHIVSNPFEIYDTWIYDNQQTNAESQFYLFNNYYRLNKMIDENFDKIGKLRQETIEIRRKLDMYLLFYLLFKSNLLALFEYQCKIENYRLLYWQASKNTEFDIFTGDVNN